MSDIGIRVKPSGILSLVQTLRGMHDVEYVSSNNVRPRESSVRLAPNVCSHRFVTSESQSAQAAGSRREINYTDVL